MADYVNLQREECDSTAAAFSRLHVLCCDEAENIIKELKKLAAADGGFYVEKISAKITDLLDMLERDSLAVLREAFEDSEQAMNDFMEKMTEIDSMG